MADHDMPAMVVTPRAQAVQRPAGDHQQAEAGCASASESLSEPGVVSRLRDGNEPGPLPTARFSLDLLADSPLILFRWARGLEGVDVRVSGNVEAVFGVDMGTCVRVVRRFPASIHREDRGRMLTSLHRAAKRGSRRVVMQPFRLEGDVGCGRWFQGSVVLERRTDGDLIAAHGYIIEVSETMARYDLLCRELEAHKVTRRKLMRQVAYDVLTGALNRGPFLDRLNQEIVRAHRYKQGLAVLLLDVDHFKQVNDQHGHAAGDQVLRSLIKTVRQGLREIDLTGRLGGEEFAVMLPHTGADGARIVAERLRESVAQMRVPLNRSSIKITMTVGVAAISDGCDNADALLAVADEALYKGKRSGRNCVV